MIRRTQRQAESEDHPKVERVQIVAFDRERRGYYVSYRGGKVGPVFTESGLKVTGAEALAEIQGGRVMRLVS